MQQLTVGDRKLKTVLRISFLVFFFATLVYALGPLIGPFRSFFKQLPFVSNSVVKVGLISLLCLYAAADVRRRRNLVVVVIVAHLVSLVAMAVFLFFLNTSIKVSLGPWELSIGNVLIGAMALDGVISLVLLAFFLNARAESGLYGEEKPSAKDGMLIRPERWLRRGLIVFGVLFSVAAIGYEAGPIFESSKGFFYDLLSRVPFFFKPKIFIELPFVSNSVVKVSALAILCFYIAKNLRKNMSLISVLIAAHILSILSLVFFVITKNTSFEVPLGPIEFTMTQVMWGAAALDGAIALVLFLGSRAAYKSRYQLKFFSPMQFRALIAVSDVVVHGEKEVILPEQIAANVDNIIFNIGAKRRWVQRISLMALQLHPLLYFKAPLSELSQSQRLAHLKKHFQREVLFPDLPDWWRRLVQAIIRVGKQISYVGYYNDPATFDSIGYTRFTERDRFHELQDAGKIPKEREHPLQVETPETIDSDIIDTEICIIGSGAAGATLAYNLAAQGKEVLVVERGKYVQPKDFSEDEGEMIGKLYADGIFQQTTDFRFTVLQGSCVGGSTVVNNAVSFDPPEHVLNHWNKKYEAGIDKEVLKGSTEKIRDFLHIGPQVSQHVKGKVLQKEYLQGKKSRQREDILNPSWRQFMYGVQNLGLEKAEDGNGIRKLFREEEGRLRLGDSLLLERVHEMAVDVVEANIVDCLGCGYCNIGCKYGKKMSMLDKMLPEAQKLENGKVRILAECEVERIRTLSGKPERIADIKARLSDSRKITIRADKYILSAGAIASSYLLLRSRIGRNLPVGRHVSFNMGAPMTAEFSDTLNAYDGLQISHYGIPKVLKNQHLERGFVLETWWNPPVAQAISMPGWFEEHFRNMQNFNKMMGIGVLVGTDNNARVKQALTGGADIDFVPTREDLLKLADGLIQAGEILFAAGARRLLLNTWGNDSFNHPNQLPRLNEIVQDPRYLTLGTGHPQGGNGISNDPFKGVVGENFKVHGYSNLYVCDASVFPSSLTVNPQLTIMSMAHYAAQIIGQ